MRLLQADESDDVSNDPEQDGRDCGSRSAKTADCESTASPKCLDYTATSEPVVQNDGALQIAAEKNLDLVAHRLPTQQKIAEVLNGALVAKR